jgi:hypothetical protein
MSHGGIGALLLCRPRAVSIRRIEGQSGGERGNAYAFESDTSQLCLGWLRLNR